MEAVAAGEEVVAGEEVAAAEEEADREEVGAAEVVDVHTGAKVVAVEGSEVVDKTAAAAAVVADSG